MAHEIIDHYFHRTGGNSVRNSEIVNGPQSRWNSEVYETMLQFIYSCQLHRLLIFTLTLVFLCCICLRWRCWLVDQKISYWSWTLKLFGWGIIHKKEKEKGKKNLSKWLWVELSFVIGELTNIHQVAQGTSTSREKNKTKNFPYIFIIYPNKEIPCLPCIYPFIEWHNV